jgi:hypothetical protein
MCIVTINLERSGAELHIARGYGRLCAIHREVQPRFVPLVPVGDYEIRMVAPAADQPDTLFWLELFETTSETTVDSYRCHNIKDAIPVFEHFVAQASRQKAYH